MSAPAVKRLIKDLKELRDEPLIGTNCEPLEDNLMIWYGIVMGMDGTPYENIPIRFTLEFSSEYPNKAPKCFFDTDIKYQGGASYKDSSGRYVVCLNIFGNLDHVHTEWKTQQEGWTPAYTVKTILLSMQSLMISDMLSSSPKDVDLTRESALKFKCSVSKHDGSDRTKWFPKVILASEATTSITTKKYDPYRDFYCCYVRKDSYADGAELGYGVSIVNPRSGMLSSPCEYLSLQAYNDGNRRSSTNIEFSYWIPICIESKNLELVMPKFIDSVKEICKGIKYQGTIDKQVCKVCCSVMCSLVVEVMNNKNNLTANDKFINGYFAFYRLLLEYAKSHPSIVTYIDKTLNDFKKTEKLRSKDSVPNLGDMLVALTISTLKWEDISDVFLLECDARNVFWYCIGNRSTPASHRELINTNYKNTDRVNKVFNATRTSQNFVMFQAKFSEVAKKLTSEVMESNNGLAPKELLDELKNTYQQVTLITSWDDYFTFLKLPIPNLQQRNQQLIDAVNVSNRQGYTK